VKLLQLQYISAVATQGSFSGAARALGVAQPALSQQIGLLETELDTTLFLRSQSGAEPTQSGSILIQHAQQILDQVELARHDTMNNSQEPSGEVSLTMANAISASVLPPLVAQIAHKYPKISLRVQSDTSPKVQLALENGRSDIGVLPDRASLKKVNTRAFVNQNLYFVEKPEVPARENPKKTITLNQCVSSPLALVRIGQPFRKQLEETAELNGASLDVKYQTNSIQMISSYVESGMACSILPWCAIEEKVLLGKLQARMITKPVIAQAYLVAWPKLRPLNVPSQIVVDTLVGSVANLIRSDWL